METCREPAATIAAPPRRRSPIVWIGLPLFALLFAYLCYDQPGIWIQYLGTPEQKAAAMIVELGGKLSRHNDDPAGPISVVDLGRTKVRTRDLEQLRGLTQLQEVHLALDDLTNVDLSSLASVPTLRVIGFWRAKFSDQTLAGLAGTTGLRVLRLGVTDLTDEQLRHLRTLTGLEEIDLSFTPLTGAGLKYLQDLPNLRVVRLRSCNLKDGLGALAALPALRELDLTYANLSPAAQRQLKSFRNLHTLILSPAPPAIQQWYRDELKDLPELKLVFWKEAD